MFVASVPKHIQLCAAARRRTRSPFGHAAINSDSLSLCASTKRLMYSDPSRSDDAIHFHVSMISFATVELPAHGFMSPQLRSARTTSRVSVFTILRSSLLALLASCPRGAQLMVLDRSAGSLRRRHSRPQQLIQVDQACLRPCLHALAHRQHSPIHGKLWPLTVQSACSLDLREEIALKETLRVLKVSPLALRIKSHELQLAWIHDVGFPELDVCLLHPHEHP